MEICKECKGGDATNDFLCSVMGDNGKEKGDDIHVAGQGRDKQLHHSQTKSQSVGINEHAGGALQNTGLYVAGYY